MFENQDDQGGYTFSYRGVDGRNIHYTIDVTDDNEMIFWGEVHSQFLNFLSSVFGYDIRNKVIVNDVLSKIEKLNREEFYEDIGNYGGNDE